MVDSCQTIDWNAIRKTALDCLEATWDMVCFAEWSQGSDYNAARALAHLMSIDRARETFKQAMKILVPGLPFATDDSCRYSQVFDSITLAVAGEVSRPDFRYGAVCCATAHEAAFELLRRVILWVELGLHDLHIASIDDLHALSLPPDELRDALIYLEKRKSLQNLLDGHDAHQIRAWIDREWAAVQTECGEGSVGKKSGDKRIPRPLTGREKEIAGLIRKEGPLTGKDICNKTGIGQSDLTSAVIPTLKEHGLINRRGAGYIFPEPA